MQLAVPVVTSQKVAPAPLVVCPAGHARHTAAPELALYRPIGHNWQLALPAVAAKLPGAHALQELAFADREVDPGGQETGEPVGEGQYCPGSALQTRLAAAIQMSEPAVVVV